MVLPVLQLTAIVEPLAAMYAADHDTERPCITYTDSWNKAMRFVDTQRNVKVTGYRRARVEQS
jgi:hypothetical protein